MKPTIRCPRCGGCTCSSCSSSHPLPSTWICKRKYECSANKCVDILSCMCFVKGALYHLFPDPDGVQNMDIEHPCSLCDQPHCCKRWTCIGLMLPCLPCLLCYWPLDCCVGMCTKCYNCVTRPDRCTCSRTSRGGQKGLLITESESSSV